MFHNLLGGNLGAQLQTFLSTPQGQTLAQQFIQNNPQALQQFMPQQQQPATLEQTFLQSQEGQQAMKAFQEKFGTGNPIQIVESKMKEYDGKFEHLIKENEELNKRLSELENSLK